VAFKPCHKFSAELGGYASKGNKFRDDWRCMRMPEEGENKTDRGTTVTDNNKIKILLNLKPKPKLLNAFATLSQLDAPTNYNVPSTAQQMDNNRTIIPPGPQE
jgi:hypothetical protein